MDFRPCIDLHNGAVKQIVGSTLSDSGAVETNFVSDKDPAWFAELYKKDSLTGGHVIKLGPGNDDAAKQALAAYPRGLQIGGGITHDNAREWLESGASQIILTSYIFSNGELNKDNLEKIYKLAGREGLVLDLSCRYKDGAYYIVTDRWQKFTAWEVNRETLLYLSDYCVEFLIHAVDVEGKQAGIDSKLLALMAEFSPIPCVYAGGIRSLDDIRQIKKTGKGKIAYTVGSALDIFGGDKLRYEDVLAFERDFK
ncbi:MAG: phosphoribosylformimino-5-aminoimidazole carboxamide ribotide isomerase [bacterium]|nr:phosphoribosylformimino-5-aminoimidazole carboxamide ribotide isomerase [bacterium]